MQISTIIILFITNTTTNNNTNNYNNSLNRNTPLNSNVKPAFQHLESLYLKCKKCLCMLGPLCTSGYVFKS